MKSVATEFDVTTGQGMVDACRRHSLFEWSAQSHVDPIAVARAKGVYFWTPEGKRFIDFNSQLMCVNIGHGDERVIRAVQDQVARLAYVNPFLASEARARLSLKLAAVCPGDIDTFFFTNGGSEANENAVRTARLFTGRHKILARYRSYHGGTAGSLTLTGDPRRWPAEPGIPGVVRVPHPYHGLERGSDSADVALSALEEIVQLEALTQLPGSSWSPSPVPTACCRPRLDTSRESANFARVMASSSSPTKSCLVLVGPADGSRSTIGAWCRIF